MKEPFQDLPQPLLHQSHHNFPLNSSQAHPAYPYEAQPNFYPLQPALNPILHQEKRFHGRSLVAMLLFLIVLIIAIVLRVKGTIDGVPTAAIIMVGYVTHLLLGLCSNSLQQYLKQVRGDRGFQAEYDRTRTLLGKFIMTADCYHYETQTHTCTVTDSEGNSSTETYTTEEKVTTHSDRQEILPVFTVDQSGPCDRLRSDKVLVFIDFRATYRFSDPQSQQKLQRIFAFFKQRNYFDSYQSYSIFYSVGGLIEKHCFLVGNEGVNFSQGIYISAIFCLLWPYSLWVESKIDRFAITFTKVVTIG